MILFDKYFVGSLYALHAQVNNISLSGIIGYWHYPTAISSSPFNHCS